MSCATLCFTALLSAATSSSAAPAALQFDFGQSGNVARTDRYDAERGYGFEPASDAAAPPRFSAKLAEGNYRITIRFGGTRKPSVTTIKAEARRLMLQDVTTARGESVTRSFIVNVRRPTLLAPPANAPGGTAVRLAASELSSSTWDEKLTLEFLGANAAVSAVSIEPVVVPTLYLAGDSTVADQAHAPAASWGQMLPRFFGSGIAVANHARSGETLKSFLTGLRLDKILSSLEPGDWLMIQFGHNDQKEHWPQTYVDARTTYRSYLRAYIDEVRRRGATPILITSPERRNFAPDGRIRDSHGEYPEAVRTVAREQSVALIDLHAMSKTFYEALGRERSMRAFADEGRDPTHHNDYGAYELARMVVAGVRACDPRLAAHLAADAGEFDPARPDPPEQLTIAE